MKQIGYITAVIGMALVVSLLIYSFYNGVLLVVGVSDKTLVLSDQAKYSAKIIVPIVLSILSFLFIYIPGKITSEEES